MNRKLSRRSFSKIITGATLSASVQLSGATILSEDSAVLKLARLLENEGFDVSDPESVVIVLFSDGHIFLGNEYPQYRTEKYDDLLVDEINSLKPIVSELFMAGDLITYHSMSPGIPAHLSHRAFAEEEYRIAKDQMKRFDYNPWVVPGNHDTNAYESNAELFREHMQVPPYQKKIIGGVMVYFLNSGNAGMLDKNQESWFRSEVALIEDDQEVLIVVHIPPMVQIWTQAGVKRILSEVFENHKTTVWVVSGHNHAFSESKFTKNGVTFVQTNTTSASRIDWAFGDDHNPGYMVLAIQNGKLHSRIFRSLSDDHYQLLSNIEVMASRPLEFMFDGIVYPLALYEEGFYEHEGRLIEFDGVHVGSYVSHCKSLTYRVVPSEYYGEIKNLVVSGVIRSIEQPVCYYSLTGVDESWIEIPFPLAKGSGLYRVVLPEIIKNSDEFYVRLETGLTGSDPGFKMSGWAIEADENSLTSYQKWLLNTYGNLVKLPILDPEAITPNTKYPNIINFAFNLLPIDKNRLSGQPSINIKQGSSAVTITYTRIKPEVNSGIYYDIQKSEDMKDWVSVLSSEYVESIENEDADWVEVKLKMNDTDYTRRFYRVRVGLLP